MRRRSVPWAEPDRMPALARRDRKDPSRPAPRPYGRAAYDRRAPTSRAAAGLSKLPPVAFVSAPMTLPMSFLEEAPSSAIVCSMSATSASPDSCSGSRLSRISTCSVRVSVRSWLFAA